MRKKVLPPEPAVALAADRVKWIKVRQTRVLQVDFSGLPPEASHAVIGHFGAAIRDQKPGSVLLLTNVRGAEYDASILTKWRQVRFEHDAKIKRSAVFGGGGLVLAAVKTFTRMLELMGAPDPNTRVRLCTNESEAREWLLKAPRPEADKR